MTQSEVSVKPVAWRWPHSDGISWHIWWGSEPPPYSNNLAVAPAPLFVSPTPPDDVAEGMVSLAAKVSAEIMRSAHILTDRELAHAVTEIILAAHPDYESRIRSALATPPVEAEAVAPDPYMEAIGAGCYPLTDDPAVAAQPDLKRAWELIEEHTTTVDTRRVISDPEALANDLALTFDAIAHGAALTHPPAAQPPDDDDMVLVPREPTEAMIAAGIEHAWIGADIPIVWRTMIAAAPASHTQGVRDAALEEAAKVAETWVQLKPPMTQPSHDWRPHEVADDIAKRIHALKSGSGR